MDQKLPNSNRPKTESKWWVFVLEVLSKIPQGSILGPLLSTIFINDLVDICTLFADDSKMQKW